MEVPQQNLPIVFSQMLQMFPNIPHEIIWMYVQQYANDTEKCAQMLNLQCGKYAGVTSSSTAADDGDLDSFQIPPLMKPIEITYDFNSDSNLTEQILLPNTTANDMNENVLDNIKSVTENKQSTSNVQNTNFSKDIPQHVSHDRNSATDLSLNLNNCVNYQKPLTLTISVDEDDDDNCSHSWRPKFSDDALSSDFFMPSPTVENFTFSSNQMLNLIGEQDLSGIEMNPEGLQGAFSAYLPPSGVTYGINVVASHLHFQKSQMNAIRYEVIKAKIELSDLKESNEKLTCELNEKMQAKSAQDIETLNEEIVQLRLECQCLCTEVDFCKQDQVLLGEVNENCYEREDSSSGNAESNRPTNYPCGHSPQENDRCSPEEPKKWQCPKCTFDNHPAITVCEMCHLPRPCMQRLPYMRPPPEQCYCHPKKETFPVQS